MNKVFLSGNDGKCGGPASHYDMHLAVYRDARIVY